MVALTRLIGFPLLDWNAITLRFYASLLSVAVIVLLIGMVTALDTGAVLHIKDALPSVFLSLVVLNLAGGYLLFRPIACFMKGLCGVERMTRRINKLPLYAAIWIFALILTTLLLHHVNTHVTCVDCTYVEFWDADAMYPVFLIVTYAILLGVYVYFMMLGYTAHTRHELANQFEIAFAPGTGRLAIKLIVAFVSTSILPMALVMLRELFFWDETHVASAPLVSRSVNLEAIEWHMGTQMFHADIIAAMLLVGVAVFFIARQMTKPINLLLASMGAVRDGDFKARAPVLSDDEVGRLTSQFNDMTRGLQEREFIRQTLGRFVPDTIAAAVIRDRGILRPQTREATILFTDIEGFTATCENLPPEEILRFLNEYFAAISKPVQQFGGVVTHFQGDSMLASFNLPVENADHAANAVRAAIEIIELSSEHHLTDKTELKTRIGINTGLVVGGVVGDGDRLGYTVYGDAVNLAARLEQINKELGTQILVSARTQTLSKHVARFSSLGDLRVRGYAEAITVYTPNKDDVSEGSAATVRSKIEWTNGQQ